MSDMSPVFYNSICKSFKISPKAQFCEWHLNKAFKEKTMRLQPKFHIEIYDKFMTLKNIIDVDIFMQELETFRNYLNSFSNKNMFEYFNTWYYSKEKYMKWALPFSLFSRCNTNCFCEANFLVFKKVFLGSKKNNRLDLVYSWIVKFNEAFEAKLKKREINYHLSSLSYRETISRKNHALMIELVKNKEILFGRFKDNFVIEVDVLENMTHLRQEEASEIKQSKKNENKNILGLRKRQINVGNLEKIKTYKYLRKVI